VAAHLTKKAIVTDPYSAVMIKQCAANLGSQRGGIASTFPSPPAGGEGKADATPMAATEQLTRS
jgi:hypothetical protein